jgi:hypothetical protein
MQNGKQYREFGLRENKEELFYVCVSYRWSGRAQDMHYATVIHILFNSR